MGYPFEKRYIEQIKENPKECERIGVAYQTLKQKYLEEHGEDMVSLPLSKDFEILGEAFQYASNILDGITDQYHFMGDVLDLLLTPTKEA